MSNIVNSSRMPHTVNPAGLKPIGQDPAGLKPIGSNLFPEDAIVIPDDGFDTPKKAQELVGIRPSGAHGADQIAIRPSGARDADQVSIRPSGAQVADAELQQLLNQLQSGMQSVPLK